jgi:hypothetical protein
VPDDKIPKTKKLKSKIHGFAADEDTGLLIEAGSRLEGNRSKFIRAAIHKYFEKKK